MTSLLSLSSLAPNPIGTAQNVQVSCCRLVSKLSHTDVHALSHTISSDTFQRKDKTYVVDKEGISGKGSGFLTTMLRASSAKDRSESVQTHLMAVKLVQM